MSSLKEAAWDAHDLMDKRTIAAARSPFFAMDQWLCGVRT